MTAEELAVFALTGPARVLARLAKRTEFYPYPTWCDRDRKSVFSQADVDAIKAEPLTHSAVELWKKDRR